MSPAKTFSEMLDEVREFHNKNDFDQQGGHEPLYRLALMQEELGEISECITKGKSREQLAEENADLLILLLGNAIAMDIDLEQAFQQKIAKIMQRTGRLVHGRIRVSDTLPEDSQG